MSASMLGGRCRVRWVAVCAALLLGFPVTVQIASAQGVALIGSVVDEQRMPVSGVTIDAMLDPAAADTKPVSVLTGRDGRFAFAGLVPGSYDIVARHASYAPRTLRSVELRSARAATPIRIELFRAMFVTGSVRDKNDRPVPGATIAATPGTEPRMQLLADKAGRFRLGPFARGTRLEVIASADGFNVSRNDSVVAPLDNLVVLLERKGVLTGRVVDADSARPINRFSIAFHRKSAVPLRTAGYPGERAFDSEDGRFEWRDLSSGTWTLTVRVKGYLPLDLENVLVPEGGTTEEVLLSLHKGQALTGRVTDGSTGVAVQGATVAWLNEQTPANRVALDPPRATVTSDAKGEFRLEDLPAGNIALRITAPGYSETRRNAAVLPGGASIDIALGMAASIEGQLLAPDRATAVSGMVRLSDRTSATSVALRTDSQGRFTFRQLKSGPYAIEAESESGRTKSQDLSINEGQQLKGVTLVLRGGRAITGVVSGLLPGERGRARVDAREPGGANFSSNVREDGTYSLINVPPGEIEMSAVTVLEREITRSIALSENGDAVVDFDFAQGGRLAGRVTRGGQPVRFAVLEADPSDGQSIHGSGETAQSGQYTIEGLARGNYVIRVAGSSMPTRVYVSGDTTLNIEMPALVLAGRVIDADSGRPLVGVELEIRPVEDSAGTAQLRASTDYSGMFSLEGLDAGDYQLSAYKSGYAQLILREHVASSVKNRMLNLEADAGAPIRVRDSASQRPLQRVFVRTMSGPGAGRGIEIPLDAQGVGSVPSSLAGGALSIWWYGYTPFTVASWQGTAIDAGLTPRRD